MTLTHRLAVALLLVSSAARAEVLPPAQDTSSLKAKLSAATGKAGTLPVSGTRKSYVMFDLTRLPVDVVPANIARATLRVYFPTAVKPGDLSVQVVTSAWNETSAGLEPTLESPATHLKTIPAAQVAPKKFAEVDVTDIVRDWRPTSAPLANFGLAFSASGLTSVTLGAKEGPGTGYPCTLDLEIDRGTLNSGIDSSQLADGAVTAPKLAAGSAAANLTAGSVALAKLAFSSVTINTTGGLSGGRSSRMPPRRRIPRAPWCGAMPAATSRPGPSPPTAISSSPPRPPGALRAC